LCRKTIMFPKIAIGQVVQLNLRRGMVIKSKLRDIVASFIEPLHCLKELIVLPCRWSKLDHQGLFHVVSIEYSNPFVKKGGLPHSSVA